MRVLSRLLYILGALSLAAWCFAYLAMASLHCSYRSQSSDCRVKRPWDLNGDDFTYMVLFPGIIVGIIFVFAWLTGREARR